MKAVTVRPGVAGSVRVEEVPEPDERTGSILVEAVAVGISPAVSDVHDHGITITDDTTTVEREAELVGWAGPVTPAPSGAAP